MFLVLLFNLQLHEIDTGPRGIPFISSAFVTYEVGIHI